ncbi:M28 family metallopeptidase [Maribacter sp. 2308TA10-17]|uniref:M28 family metallopeptidase n=1 Tax=Maribacter sp. 2308TA10-17 TaxID=3386276 RepID=UPI0039BD51C2
MKIIPILMISFFLANCGSTKMKETDASNVQAAPAAAEEIVNEAAQAADAQKEEMSAETKLIAPVPDFSNAEEIGEIMNFLASDELQGRDSGSEGIAKAADFIEEIFTANGIKPYFANFRDTLSNFNQPAYNMVGMLEGTDPELKKEFIVLGAHYDHIGRIQAKDGDDIANGANDNASGTTTVLELARYFGKVKANKRSILFTLFSAEEQGLLGSKHLAKKLKASGLNLYAMLNFEMVGVPLQGKDYLMYLTGYNLSNLAEISNAYSEQTVAGFLPKAKEFNLFNRSDNAPFHEIYNVPSHTYSTFDFTNFDHYHQVGDEAEVMDFGHMANVVNVLIPVMEGIINSPEQEIKYN